ncbi:hypothetical protein DYH55_10920 [Methylovirgula sp. 4M-Z18]|nr:hypothetical protein DYH55_10920 [Methylovirgula sp. 4M-Z18]
MGNGLEQRFDSVCGLTPSAQRGRIADLFSGSIPTRLMRRKIGLSFRAGSEHPLSQRSALREAP